MNIALTGSSGVVGSQLAKYFLRRGENVFTVHSKEKRKFSENQFSYSSLKENNRTDIDLIVHVGASKPDKNFPNPNFDYICSNLMPTIDLVEWSLKQERTFFIYISSTHIKEFCEIEKISSPVKASKVKELEEYFLSKYMSEIFVSRFLEANKVPFSIIRIGTPFSSELCGSEFVQKLISNTMGEIPTEVFANMDDILNMTWLQDIIFTIDILLKSDKNFQSIDLVSSSLSLREIIKIVSIELKKQALIREISKQSAINFVRRTEDEVLSHLNVSLTPFSEGLKSFLKNGLT